MLRSDLYTEIHMLTCSWRDRIKSTLPLNLGAQGQVLISPTLLVMSQRKNLRKSLDDQQKLLWVISKWTWLRYVEIGGTCLRYLDITQAVYLGPNIDVSGTTKKNRKQQISQGFGIFLGSISADPKGKLQQQRCWNQQFVIEVYPLVMSK